MWNRYKEDQEPKNKLGYAFITVVVIMCMMIILFRLGYFE